MLAINMSARLKGRAWLSRLSDALTGAIVCLGVLILPIRWIRKAVLGPGVSLWAGTPILTLGSNARAERLLGADARSLVFSTYYVTKAFDYDLSRYTAYPGLGRILHWLVFLWVCVVADRLHFFCDRGILPSRERLTFDFRELRAYRALGIDVFLYAYGADVRNREVTLAMGHPNACTDCDAPSRYCICDAKKAAANMQQLLRLSRAVFAGMGDMFEYVPGSINNLYYWPIDLDAEGGLKYQPTFPAPTADRPLRIVHAANHRMFKGTRFLIQAVESLKADGCAVELVLVEGKSNAEALALYRSADVIFDQCLLGNFGYFALEGMALGKPVMCFIRRPDQELPYSEECPIINVNVQTLEEDIRRVADSRADLAALGMRSRAYVEKYFSLPAFAARLGAMYSELGVAI